MQYIGFKNWNKYQHYKHENPKWIKLHVKLLDSYGFDGLSDAGKGHLLGLLLLAAKKNNKIPYDAKYIRKKIYASSRVNIQKFIDVGLMEVVEGSQDDAALDARIAAAEALPEQPEPKEVSASALFIRDRWPVMVAACNLKLSQVRLQSRDDKNSDPLMTGLRELIDHWVEELGAVRFCKRLTQILKDVKAGDKWYSLKAVLADSELMKGKINGKNKNRGCGGRVNDQDHSIAPEWEKNKRPSI